MMKKYILVIAIFTFIIGFNFATSPKMPVFEYNISGHLLCDSLDSNSNYTVQLFGKDVYSLPEYTVLRGIGNAHEITIALSDSSGYFYLSVQSDRNFDSLKVGIISHEKPVFYGNAFYVDQTQFIEITSFYTPENNSGCSCTSEPEEERVEKNIFRYSQADINICGK